MRGKIAVLNFILILTILFTSCGGKTTDVDNSPTVNDPTENSSTNNSTTDGGNTPGGTTAESTPTVSDTVNSTAPTSTPTASPTEKPTAKPEGQVFSYWVNFPEKGEVKNLYAHKFVITAVTNGLKVEAYNKDNSKNNASSISLFNNWLCSYTLKDAEGKVLSSGNSSARYEYFQINHSVTGSMTDKLESGKTFKGYYKDYKGSNTIIADASLTYTVTLDTRTLWKFSAEYSSIPKGKNASISNVNNFRTIFRYDIKPGLEMYRDEFENIHFVAVPEMTVNNGVPTMIINTKNNAPVYDKINWVSGTFAIVEGFKKEYNTLDQKGNLSIKGRGNTSWTVDNGEKRPYSIELEKNIELLGMPDNRDWCLIANHSDKTLMRNFITYNIASKMSGFDYAPRAKYVELYLNNTYYGLYTLVEKIEAGKEKVNISETVKGEKFKDIMSGSFLVEKESIDRFNDIEQALYQSVNTALGTMNIKSPGRTNLIKEDKITNRWEPFMQYYDQYYKYKDPVKKYIQEYFDLTNSAIRAIRDGNYILYKRYIDVDSFIDYIILQELTKNIDGNMKVSIFFYKDKGGKLHIGPVWDFDIAWGNCDYDNGEGQTPGWTTDGFMLKDAAWFKDLMKDPEFYASLKKRYKELRDKQFKDIIPLINSTEKYISKAAESNFNNNYALNRYVWPNPPEIVAIDNYKGQVEHLRNWVTNRLKWLDSQWYNK